MSLTFSLVCDETRQKVWIGQGHHQPLGTNETNSGPWQPVMEVIYSGNIQVMADLCHFLNSNRDKPLRFVVDDYDENATTWEYAQVTAPPTHATRGASWLE